MAATTVTTISCPLATPTSDVDTKVAMSASEAIGTCWVVPIIPGTLLRSAMTTASTVLANSVIPIPTGKCSSRGPVNMNAAWETPATIMTMPHSIPATMLGSSWPGEYSFSAAWTTSVIGSLASQWPACP